jgi:hypothetical protein
MGRGPGFLGISRLQAGQPEPVYGGMAVVHWQGYTLPANLRKSGSWRKCSREIVNDLHNPSENIVEIHARQTDSWREIPFPPAKAQAVASLRESFSLDCSYECDGNTSPKRRTLPGSEAKMGPRAGRGMALFPRSMTRSRGRIRSNNFSQNFGRQRRINHNLRFDKPSTGCRERPFRGSIADASA